MRDDPHHQPEPSGDTLAFFGATARFFAAGFGIILILIGLYYAVQVVGELLAGFREPQAFATRIDQWEELIGPDTLRVENEQATINGARVIAVGLLVTLSVVLGWLSLALVFAGAKVVQLTTSDRDTVRRVLRELLGKNYRR